MPKQKVFCPANRQDIHGALRIVQRAFSFGLGNGLDHGPWAIRPMGAGMALEIRRVHPADFPDKAGGGQFATGASGPWWV